MTDYDLKFRIEVTYKDTLLSNFFVIPYTCDQDAFLRFSENPSQAAMEWFESIWTHYTELFMDPTEVRYIDHTLKFRDIDPVVN